MCSRKCLSLSLFIVSKDEITSVILTGGSTRTPMIQTAVRDAVGEWVYALFLDNLILKPLDQG